MKFNIQDIYENEPFDDDQDQPSDEEILKDLHKQSSKKLADIVISFRYLGLFKKLSIPAMEELAKRRVAGDVFEYEKYIEENLQNLPKLDFSFPNLDNILKNFKNP